MRILAIRGRNLASLAGDFAIDFEAEPLGSSPIFAITGPTGAGKSTLLDAVCLALFRDVPRLRSAPGGSIGNDGISPGDARALMRHGTTDAFAEVDFAMPDGRRYQARWSVSRARTGTLKNDDHTFARLDDGERLGGTRTETKAAIHDVVGLTADQFCRAALLAQGDFDAFVKADATQRADLLEKLTGSTIYAEIGRKAFQQAGEHRQRIDAIKRDITAQNGLDDAQRADLETQLAGASAALAAQQAALDTLQKAERWERRGAELAGLIEAAAKDHALAAEADTAAAPRRDTLVRDRAALAFAPRWQALESARRAHTQLATTITSLTERTETAGKAVAAAKTDDAAREQALAAQHEHARGLQPQINEARRIDVLHQQAVETHAACTKASADAAAALTKAEADAEQAAKALAATTAERDTAAAWLNENAALGPLAQREAELADMLASHAAKAAQHADLAGKAKTADAAVQQAKTALEGAQATLTLAQAALDAARAAREQAESAMPPPEEEAQLNDHRDALAGVARLLEQAGESAAAVHAADARLGTTRTRLRDTRAKLQSGTARLAEIAMDLPQATARRDEAQGAASRAEAAAGETAAALREQLVPGEPCSVCGATEHRLDAVTGVLGEHVLAARAHADALAQDVAALDRETVKLEAAHSGLEDRARVLAADEIEQAKGLAAATEQQAALAAQLATTATAAGVAGEAASLPDRLASAQADIANRIAAARSARTARDDAITAERAAAGHETTARSAAEQAKQKLDLHTHVLHDIEAEQRDAAKEAENLAEQLDRAIAALCDWRALPDGPRWLSARCEEWRSALTRRDAADAALLPLAAAMHDVAANLRTAQDRAGDAETALGTANKRTADLAGQRALLLGGESVAAVTARLEQAGQDLTQARELARKALTDAAQRLAEAEALRTSAEAQAEADARALAEQEATFAAALAGSTTAPGDVERVAQAGSAALDAETDALAKLAQTAASAANLLTQRQADLTRHEAEDAPDLLGPDLIAALAVAQAEVETGRTLRGDLELRLRQDDAVRAHTATLRTALEKANDAATVWLKLESLIGDATGKKFRNFAQGLTLDRLLEHANARLADLKPRYTLARGLGGDMAIEVIDNDMAGEVRGLLNLSGGERFLVSLALALGLAEMSTARGMRIESLFIDEGFGALDPASLGQALALLEHLHASGRRVGVISHVEELKERIPVKIEVTPTGRGTSEIRVVSG